MGMSTHVFAFREPDAKWKKMKAVWDACVDAQVDIPENVIDFFGGENPDPAGVEVKIPYRDYESDTQDGIEIDVAAIPEGTATIRFVNSW